MPAAAREAGRQIVGGSLQLPNFLRHLRNIGYTEDDLAGGGSDRLVDHLVAWVPTTRYAHGWTRTLTRAQPRS